VYLGPPTPHEAPLSNRPALFGPVLGSISRPVDLDAYEIIIAYAVLRRTYREGRTDLVLPVGNVLKERLREIRGGGSYGSWQDCLEAIEAATTEILRSPVRTSNPPARISRSPPTICR
jgi:hypothetical protein